MARDTGALRETDPELLKSGLSLKEKGKTITGEPDDWDRDNIQKFLDIYEKAYPGRLKRMATDVKVEVALSGRDKTYGTISKASDRRLVMWMPADLQEVIEKAYPSFWDSSSKGKRHLGWFLRHFPIFKAAEKV